MPLVKELRFDVHLTSLPVLMKFMDHHGLTVRALAKKVGCSPSVIGHLHSGRRTTVSSKNAKAIEKALDAPPGLLFTPRVTTVTRERGRAAA